MDNKHRVFQNKLSTLYTNLSAAESALKDAEADLAMRERTKQAAAAQDVIIDHVILRKTLAATAYKELCALRREHLGDDYVDLHPIRIDGNYL